MAKRILVALIFVPIIFVVIVFLPSLVWAAVIAFIAAMSAYELMRATGEGKLTMPMQVVTLISAVLIPLGVWLGIGVVTAFVCTFAVMVVSFWCAIRAYSEENVPIGLYHVLLTIFGGGIIPLALSSLVMIRGMAYGRYMVLMAVLLTFITDGAAYFGGVFLGKHRGITKVSAKKSLEGYITGFAGGVAFAVIYGLVIGAIEGRPVKLLPLVLCGLFGALITELGDLVFSFIKRQYGVKDFGNLLPGHGGMLDRFDSMILCSPVVFFIIHYLPVF